MIDFHCHLDLYPDHAGVIAECERQEIFTLAVTTTPRAWPRNHELASPTKYVRATAMAALEVEQDGLDSWLGASLSFPQLDNVAELRGVVDRGLAELARFLRSQGVT